MMFYQMFLSPQVKRSMLISNKHCIHELLYELSSDLRLWERSGKSQDFLEL